MPEPDHLIAEIRELRNQVEAQAAEIASLQQQIRANNQHIDQLEKTLLEYDRGELRW